MSQLRFLQLRTGDADHPAEVVGVLPSGTLRTISLTLQELAQLVSQASNILEREVRETLREDTPQ